MLFKKIGILDPDGKFPNPLTGKPYSQLYKHIAENGAPNLNILNPKAGWKYMRTYNERNQFFKMMKDNQVILVVAGTGVGKSVVIPKLAAHYFDYKGKILFSIPTIKAVVSSAKYAASCLDVQYGMEVAARTSEINDEFDPKRTTILYATDGFISSKIKTDPLLSEYSCIFIDEVHTRGTNIDILISSVTEIAKVRPDFRIIAMSATVDPSIFKTFFKKAQLSYQLYEIPGVESNYKVKHIFNTQKISNISDYQGKPMIDKVVELLKTTKSGNILCFISIKNAGLKNIKALQQIFDNSKDPLKEFNTIPWLGMLEGKTEESIAAICKGETKLEDLPPGKYGKYTRSVVFATNAVEFSVTFKDLDYVIESGLSWAVEYDLNVNCTVMENKLTAQSNIKQRCGRTGRTAPGTCIRMYTKEVYDNLLKFALPPILKEEMTSGILDFMCIERTNTFSTCNVFLSNMITPIEDKAKKIFFNNLLEHDIMGLNGKLTALGKMISQIKSRIEYNYKKMVIASYYFEAHTEIIPLICILSVVNKIDDFFINPELKLGDFKGNRTEKQALLSEIKINFLKPFIHSSGDHISMLNIYQSTLPYRHDQNRRMDHCIKYDINPRIISKIDEGCGELIGDKYTDGVYKNILPFIVLLELFDVQNSIGQKRLLKKIKEEMAYNPVKFILLGGEYDKNKKNFKENPKNKFQKKKPNQFQKKQPPKHIFRKSQNKEQYKNIDFKKFKDNFTLVKNKHMSKKLSSKKSKRKSKGSKGIKGSNKKKGKLNTKKKNKNNVFLTEEYKENLRLIKKQLDTITFKNRGRRFPLKISDDRVDNVLSCLFYCFFNQIGIRSEDKNSKYLLKQNKTFNINLYDSNTILNNFEEKPKYIIYDQLTLIMNMKTVSTVSAIPEHIIKKFGFNI